MSNLDKIRQEIERRRLHLNKEAEKYQALNNGYSQNCYGARDALRDLENFIDSLQQEQPSEDLEKYASRAGFDYVDDIESKYPNHRWNDHDVEFAYRDGIIAGAEWQKEQMLKAAVEGVMIDSLRVQIMAPLNAVIQREGLKDGDKMKILIVKEAEK